MKNKKLINRIQVGDVFGDLTVLRIHSKPEYKAECKCACGQLHSVSIYHLFSGNTTTCGCGLFSIRNRGGQGHTTYQYAFQTYRRNAKKQKRNFELTLERFKKLVSLNCHYCNAEPKLMNRYLDGDGNQKRKNKKYQQSTIDMAYIKINGLDRINNAVGYEKGNVIPCCYVCNRAKHVMEYKEFIQWISRLKTHKIHNKLGIYDE